MKNPYIQAAEIIGKLSKDEPMLLPQQNALIEVEKTCAFMAIAFEMNRFNNMMESWDMSSVEHLPVEKEQLS